MWLAPAAVTALAGCIGVNSAAQQAGGSKSWRRKLTPRLAEISARDAIPFLIFVLVLVPVVISSMIGTVVSALVLLGIRTPYVVTAGKGVSFRSWSHAHRHGPQVNDAVAAIASLNFGQEAIANLDFANPFPVLFLAPPPKGIQVWWDFGFNVSRAGTLEWQNVIGDACVVTIPAQPDVPQTTVRLAEVVRPKLSADFEIVYQGEFWTIYRRTGGCTSADLAFRSALKLSSSVPEAREEVNHVTQEDGCGSKINNKETKSITKDFVSCASLMSRARRCCHVPSSPDATPRPAARLFAPSSNSSHGSA